MTNAFHSSSNNDGAYMGEPCGIVVRAEGKSVYFAGDTCVFGDMALIGRLYKPDLAVLPIGDHYTMGPEEAALALELLGVKRCVPCHWGTFPPLVGRPETLQELAPDVTGRDDRAGRVGHGMRERWWGASGRQVPELAVEGDPAVPVDEALVVDSPHDPADDPRGVRGRHAGRRPRRDAGGRARRARAARGGVRPRPRGPHDLLALDLTELTYGA